MLQISVPITPEGWDEEKQEFVEPKYQVLQLEHSLVSLSKWESKWCKSFLSKQTRTAEEITDYVRCMTLTQNVKPEVYNFLTNENIKQIEEYINAPMTATYFSQDDQPARPNREVVTSELIYYWMIALNIPFECQKWHLNRLLTLVQVCNKKNQAPNKKRSSKADTLKQYAALNAARRKQHNTKG